MPTNSSIPIFTNQSRVVVIGTTGVGKSTFARKLAAKLSVPDIELDALHWGPNWTPREQFKTDVERAVAASEGWVVHGGYSVVREVVWGRATDIVWLDYAPVFAFARLLRRTVARAVKREELWAGNRESFRISFFSTNSILAWFFRTYWENRRRFPEAFKQPQFSHLKIYRSKNPSDAESLLRAQ